MGKLDRLKKLLGSKPAEDPLRMPRAEVDAFKADPEGTFLVSFPRTGSHWLRMSLELYFERPLLVRCFFEHPGRDYLLLHTHDMELDVLRKDVLYLYRDPVDTLFSQLEYHGEDGNDGWRRLHWTTRYGAHLVKWLEGEGFSTKKTILTYEKLKQDTTAEFARVVGHFGGELDAERLSAVTSSATKGLVKERTTHDQRVLRKGPEYEERRTAFRRQYEQDVWETLSAVISRVTPPAGFLDRWFPPDLYRR